MHLLLSCVYSLLQFFCLFSFLPFITPSQFCLKKHVKYAQVSAIIMRLTADGYFLKFTWNHLVPTGFYEFEFLKKCAKATLVHELWWAYLVCNSNLYVFNFLLSKLSTFYQAGSPRSEVFESLKKVEVQVLDNCKLLSI